MKHSVLPLKRTLSQNSISVTLPIPPNTNMTASEALELAEDNRNG